MTSRNNRAIVRTEEVLHDIARVAIEPFVDGVSGCAMPASVNREMPGPLIDCVPQGIFSLKIEEKAETLDLSIATRFDTCSPILVPITGRFCMTDRVLDLYTQRCDSMRVKCAGKRRFCFGKIYRDYDIESRLIRNAKYTSLP